MKIKLFLNSSLSSLGNRMLNEKIIDILKQYNIEIYAPQIELPIYNNITAQEILLKNIEAVKNADYILSIIDKPGLGVGIELGVAISYNKQIIMFKASNEQNGKMIDGLWDTLSNDHKATTLDDLMIVLDNLFNKNV